MENESSFKKDYMKKLIILFLLFFSTCQAKEYTDGDKKLSVHLLVYEDHLYLLFDNKSVVHHPDCPCYDPPDDGNHSYLD